MPSKYTPEEKENALNQLQANYGNVMITSIQLGIPARTLREWKQIHRIQTTADKNEQRRQNGGNSETDDDDNEEEENPYRRLQQELLQHIFDLSANLATEPETAHVQAMALTRLLDRVIKLDAIVARHDPEQIIRYEYKYPDGTIHDRAPWAPEDDSDAWWNHTNRFG